MSIDVDKKAAIRTADVKLGSLTELWSEQMLKKVVQVLGVTCLLVSTGVMSVQAQDVQLGPEKRALIKELLTVTNAGKNTGDMVQMMMVQMEASLPQLLKTTFTNTMGLQGEELQQRITEASVRIFKRYKELLPQRVNFAQEIEQISYAVYGKYYTESELRDLIAFYKTATGQKVIAVMPRVAQESIQQSVARLMPQQMQLIQEIVQQEVRNIQN